MDGDGGASELRASFWPFSLVYHDNSYVERSIKYRMYVQCTKCDLTSVEDELVVPGVRLVIEEENVVAAVVASSEIGWASRTTHSLVVESDLNDCINCVSGNL